MTEYADGYEPGMVYVDDADACVNAEIDMDRMSEDQRRAYRAMMVFHTNDFYSTTLTVIQTQAYISVCSTI